MPVKQFAERDRAITIEYLSGGVTGKMLANKYGISIGRINQILEYQRRRLTYLRGRIKIHKIVGVLIDPDGVDGSVLQEWTPEQQWQEFEVSDGYCGVASQGR